MSKTLLLLAGFAYPVLAQTGPDFDRNIRPILQKNCFSCHNKDTKTSGFVVETPASILNGGSLNGPAIISGHSAESPLILYLRGEKTPAMPKGRPPLSGDEVANIAKWIDSMPPQATAAANKPRSWPFTNVSAPTIPSVVNSAWLRNPIDAFLLSKMEQKGLSPAPPASKRALLRRIYFDLIGLPPTPTEMERFISDPKPDAYEREIERLLADPRYGERWGRHWLDVVRYADSAGTGNDYSLPHIWRYRDYVIRAFNQDRPYDRFIREQLAGDAFPVYGAEGKIATGFLRLGVAGEGSNVEVRRDLLIDLVNTTGSVFLGLTVGCARCHDHKFDPITTRDYYRMEAFFAPVTIGAAPLSFTPDEQDSEWARKAKEWEQAIQENKQRDEKLRAMFKDRVAKAMVLSSPQDLKDVSLPATSAEIVEAVRRGVLFSKEEQEQYEKLERRSSSNNPGHPDLYKPMAFVASEQFGGRSGAGPNLPLAPTTYVLRGGNPRLKGQPVEPGFLSAVTGNEASVDLEGVTESPRKLLADWIADASNPLTARVMVNRIWQHHFSDGLVLTPNDFGKNGSGTQQPELLDWLSAQFVQSGWSIKAMHRLILQSNSYRQSMNNPRASEFTKTDPGNRYLWRMNPIRLDSEVIRDSILAISGELNPSAGGPGFFPSVEDEVLRRSETWWQPSSAHERKRRSVYMLVKRSVTIPLLTLFDGPNANESCPVRGVTTVTPQVFALFNSSFAHEQSRAMSERVVREAGPDPERQIEQAYQLALQRPPSERERSESIAFVHQGSLAELCLVLINLNEFIMLE